MCGESESKRGPEVVQRAIFLIKRGKHSQMENTATTSTVGNANKNTILQPAITVGQKTTSHLYAGFLSGLTSSIILQPLDLLKTRVQQSEGTSVINSLKEIKTVKALWRGTVPSALRTSVGSALYFTTLNATRTHIANLTTNQNNKNRKPDDKLSSTVLPKLSMHANLASGAIVRGAVGFATMPITVIKVQYESTFYNYNSILGAARGIYTKSGLPGFFYGFGVTFVRDAPYAGLYVLFYEKSKELMNKFVSRPDSTVSSPIINSSSAILSATLATTITAPFDTIKTRVQLDHIKYPSFLKTAKIIIAKGGVVDLFDGLSLRLMRKAMSAGIAWCIYEELVKRV